MRHLLPVLFPQIAAEQKFVRSCKGEHVCPVLKIERAVNVASRDHGGCAVIACGQPVVLIRLGLGQHTRNVFRRSRVVFDIGGVVFFGLKNEAFRSTILVLITLARIILFLCSIFALGCQQRVIPA